MLCEQKHTQDDSALVKAAALGDSDALEVLFIQNREKLIRFVQSKTGAQDEVEDLVQETFIQAQLSIQKFQGNSKFSTWLIGISYNIIRNYLSRSVHKKYDFVGGEYLDQIQDTRKTPEQANKAKELMTSLNDALANLPSDSKDMILSISVDGQTYEEVAQRHGCSVSALKSRIFRVRQALRQQMQDHL